MNKKEAEIKLRNHIVKCGHKNCVLTYSIILYWFRIINMAAFENKLQVPNIGFRELRDAWGTCTSGKDNCTLIFRPSIQNRELLISTIAHEMTHIWQHNNTNSMSHGISYIKWSNYFKKNFNIKL